MTRQPSREIFICAADVPVDRQFTRRLSRDLRRCGFNPVVAHQHDDEAHVFAAIDRAEAVLVVASPQVLRSEAAQRQYRHAARRPGGTIVPLRVTRESATPPELSNIQWVDFFTIYALGLQNLTKVLGSTRPDLERRVVWAKVWGRIIPLLRTVLAILLGVARASVFWGTSNFIAFILPALFVGIGEEDYERGDAVKVRIVLAKIVGGAMGGAACANVLALVYAAAQGTSPQFDILPQVAFAVVGGGLGWFAIWREQRTLARGATWFRTTMRVVRFAAKSLIFILWPFSGSYDISTSHVSAPTGIDPGVVILQVVGFLAAATILEWMHSPVRKTKRATVDEVHQVTGMSGPCEVFISHSSADNALVIKLARDLEQRGFATWVDRRKLVPGTSWPESIRTGLTQARTILLMWSPVAQNSAWVTEEYRSALAQGKRVVIARLDETVAIPPPLQGVEMFEFSPLYVEGLLSVLMALRAPAAVVTHLQRAVTRRIRSIQLINFVRFLANSYMMAARVVLYAVIAYSLFQGVSWVVGAALGVAVELAGLRSIAGLPTTRWSSAAHLVNAFMIPIVFGAFIPFIGADPSSPSTVSAAGSAGAYGSAALFGLVLLAVEAFFLYQEPRALAQGKQSLTQILRVLHLYGRSWIGSAGQLLCFFVFLHVRFGPVPVSQGNSGNVVGDIIGTVITSAIAVALFAIFPMQAMGVICAAIQVYLFPSLRTRKALRQLAKRAPERQPVTVAAR